MSQRIRKHYRQIARGAAEPALQVLQAPVFHGHGFSVYLEMEKPVAIADLSQALAGEHVVVSGVRKTLPPTSAPPVRETSWSRLTSDAESQERRVALGNDRQPARRRFDRGGMRRDHDRVAPARPDSMSSDSMRRCDLSCGCGDTRA